MIAAAAHVLGREVRVILTVARNNWLLSFPAPPNAAGGAPITISNRANVHFSPFAPSYGYYGSPTPPQAVAPVNDQTTDTGFPSCFLCICATRLGCLLAGFFYLIIAHSPCLGCLLIPI